MNGEISHKDYARKRRERTNTYGVQLGEGLDEGGRLKDILSLPIGQML